MVDLVEKAYADRMTVKTVSAALRGKPAVLGRLFHHVVGVSVHGYVTRVRLARAAHLITSNVKVEAVALAVGYRSKKNFYRQFLRHFGMTPEAYRRRPVLSTGPSGGGSGARAATNGVARYAGLFDSTACIIEIEPRPNVKGRPSYVATPFVIADHGLQPFVSPGEVVEILADTEAEAVERAAIFLEHRFGARAGAPKRHYDDRRVLPSLGARP
jgi:AraC-like DNA-binding protein